MITVLHVITGLGVGGAEMMLAKLVSGSDRARYRHVVASMVDGGPVADPIRAAGVAVYELGMQRGVPTAGALRRTRALLRAVRPDVIQGWMYHGNVLASVASTFLGVPVLWNVRSGGQDAHRVAEWARHLSWQPVGVVVNSERGRDFHHALGYRPRVWWVIPNGFDLCAFRPDPAARAAVRAELGVSADTPLVGVVARFDPQKDHRTFCHALHVARARVPTLRAVLAGTDCTPANAGLGAWLREAGVSDAVHLLGRRADVAGVINALDVVASSSNGEGFSNAIGEAMACAVPAVVTDVGDSAAVVGDAGTVVPARDPEALGRAIADMISLPPNARAEIGQRGRARVAQEFALPLVVARYETLYSAVVQSGALACAG